MRNSREKGQEDARKHLESWQELGYDSPQDYLVRADRFQREERKDLQNHIKYPGNTRYTDADFAEEAENYIEGWNEGTQETAADMGYTSPKKPWWHW